MDFQRVAQVPKNQSFFLFGSRGALRSLFPLVEIELATEFDLQKAISWGTLPGVWNADDDLVRRDMLSAYAATYLKEEIGAEQLVRELDPFRRFAEVAARQSGKILNYSRIGQDVGVDFKSVKSWYEILEDTLVGLSVPPAESTSYFGDLFEQMVICELKARSVYANNDFQFHYLQTKSGLEVDLVISRPGRPLAFVEIKSAKEAKLSDAKGLHSFKEDFPDADFVLASRDPAQQHFGSVQAVHWTQAFELISKGS